MVSLAQMERELLVERTKAGLAAAKERGEWKAEKGFWLQANWKRQKNY
jgi:DNA invertase Pin-like site-specific DNA recombinase